MAIVESESDLMMGWLMIRTFYNSPSIPDYSGKADALIRLKRAMRKFMREQPPCREWIVKDYSWSSYRMIWTATPRTKCKNGSCGIGI